MIMLHGFGGRACRGGRRGSDLLEPCLRPAAVRLAGSWRQPAGAIIFGVHERQDLRPRSRGSASGPGLARRDRPDRRVVRRRVRDPGGSRGAGHRARRRRLVVLEPRGHRRVQAEKQSAHGPGSSSRVRRGSPGCARLRPREASPVAEIRKARALVLLIHSRQDRLHADEHSERIYVVSKRRERGSWSPPWPAPHAESYLEGPAAHTVIDDSFLSATTRASGVSGARARRRRRRGSRAPAVLKAASRARGSPPRP